MHTIIKHAKYVTIALGQKGEPMINAEAIETLRANYPDACYEQLREAVDAAIEALKAQDATGDTISRQAAIEVLYSVDEYNPRSIKAIKDLPSVQLPEPYDYNYERAVEQLEHDILYEPTFNKDDGSM